MERSDRISSKERADRPLVLVTGVSGLIGTQVARTLWPEYRIVGLDIKPPDPDDLGEVQVDFYETDLTDDHSTAEVLEKVRQEHGGHVASVIHLAAYYDFSGEPSPLYEELTVEGTRRLLRELRKFERVEQFVFSSSILVMEPTEPGGAFSEESPTQAEWDYPRSKLEAERVILSEHGDIPAVLLRIAGVYDDGCHALPIAQHISRIYEQTLESYVFPGDADSGQAFVHMDDLMDCLKRVVEKRQELGPEETFIIAEPEVVSYAELQEMLGQMIHGKKWPTVRVPKAVAKVGAWMQEQRAGEDEKTFIKPWMIDLADDHYAADISRARQKLGWLPQRTLAGTLPEMVRHLKDDPVGWYRANKLPVPEDLPAE